MLNDPQIDFIQWDLQDRGLTTSSLQEEVLDHVCCVVEEKMAAGSPFVTAYKEAVEAFGPQGFETLQIQTHKSVNQKPIQMLKATLLTSLMIIGVIAAYAIFHQPIKLPPDGGIWSSPLGNKYEVTSGFGMRIHPVLKTKKRHLGVDFRAPLGTEVFAARDGVIHAAGVAPKEKEGYGIIISIKHDSSFQTMYAHLSEVKVEVGEEVKAGQLIGLTGNSGFSLGPHLHFEVKKEGFYVNPENFPDLVLANANAKEH